MKGKADFDTIYGQSDPRAYYATLCELDYQVPVHGTAVFDAVLDTLPQGGDGATIVDVCCSYGINAALINHDVEFEEVVSHYTAPALGGLDRAELVERDRAFFEPRKRDRQVDVIGLDASSEAIGYALDAGLLSDGLAADLESDVLIDGQGEVFAGTDLITVTGGVGYVGPKTFSRVLDACGDVPPAVAAITLRWVDYEPIASMLAERGLETERLADWHVPQRRYADEDEARHVSDALDDLDRDTTEWEEDGWHAAEVFVSRLPGAVADQSAADMLAESDAEPPVLNDVVEIAQLVENAD